MLKDSVIQAIKICDSSVLSNIHDLLQHPTTYVQARDLCEELLLHGLELQVQELLIIAKGALTQAIEPGQMMLYLIQESQTKLGSDHVVVYSAKMVYSIILHTMGLFDSALALQQATLSNVTQMLGETHWLVAHILADIGDTEYVMGHYAEARDQFERSMRVFETTVGTDHPHYWMACMHLACALSQLNEHETKSASLFQIALDGFCQVYGESHRVTQICRQNQLLETATKKE